MLNKKGMILMEALILLMITMIIVNVLALCVKASMHMHNLAKEGFHDQEVQAIYEER